MPETTRKRTEITGLLGKIYGIDIRAYFGRDMSTEGRFYGLEGWIAA